MQYESGAPKQVDISGQTDETDERMKGIGRDADGEVPDLMAEAKDLMRLLETYEREYPNMKPADMRRLEQQMSLHVEKYRLTLSSLERPTAVVASQAFVVLWHVDKIACMFGPRIAVCIDGLLSKQIEPTECHSLVTLDMLQVYMRIRTRPDNYSAHAKTLLLLSNLWQLVSELCLFSGDAFWAAMENFAYHCVLGIVEWNSVRAPEADEALDNLNKDAIRHVALPFPRASTAVTSVMAFVMRCLDLLAVALPLSKTRAWIQLLQELKTRTEKPVSIHPLDAGTLVLSRASFYLPFAPTRETLKLFLQGMNEFPFVLIDAVLWFAAFGVRKGRRKYGLRVLRLCNAAIVAGYDPCKALSLATETIRITALQFDELLKHNELKMVWREKNCNDRTRITERPFNGVIDMMRTALSPIIALLAAPKQTLKNHKTRSLAFRLPLGGLRADLVQLPNGKIQTRGGVRILTVDTSLGTPSDISHIYSLVKLERVCGLHLMQLFDFVVCTSLSALWLSLIMCGVDSYTVYRNVMNVSMYVLRDNKANVKRIVETAGRERYSDLRLLNLLHSLFGDVRLGSTLNAFNVTPIYRMPVFCYVVQDVAVRGVILASTYTHHDLASIPIAPSLKLGDTVAITAPCAVSGPCPVETFHQTIRACAASPTTHAPLRIKGYTLTDGGFSINNFVATACLTAKAIFENEPEIVVDVGIKRSSSKRGFSEALGLDAPPPPNTRAPHAKPDFINILTWGAAALNVALQGHSDRDAGIRVAESMGTQRFRLDEQNGNPVIDAAAKALAASLFYVEARLEKPVRVGELELYVLSKHRVQSVSSLGTPINEVGVGIQWTSCARDVDTEMMLERQTESKTQIVALRPGGLLDAQPKDFKAVVAEREVECCVEDQEIPAELAEREPMMVGGFRRFKLTVRMLAAGAHDLTICYRGVPISGMPLKLSLVPLAPDGASELIATELVVGKKAYVQVKLVDMYGNTTYDTSSLECSVVHGDEPVECSFASYRNIVFLVFTPPRDDEYVCSVLANGKHVTNSPMTLKT